MQSSLSPRALAFAVVARAKPVFERDPEQTMASRKRCKTKEPVNVGGRDMLRLRTDGTTRQLYDGNSRPQEWQHVAEEGLKQGACCTFGSYSFLSMSRHFHCRQASSDFDVHALEPRLQKHGALDLIGWQILRFTRAQNPKP